MQREEVERIVIGEPRQPNGQPSENLARVQQFVARWRKAHPEVPIEYFDERFTSVLAHQAMIDGGMKASARRDKKSVDRISAAIILQGYMDRTSGATFAVNPDSVPENRSRKTARNKRRND